jgi:hypothetical protein
MNGIAAIHTQLIPHVLSSWKEIASFLGKGVRTVQRWESSLGLPIHRPSGNRGVILAYPAEIDAWCQEQWTGNKFASKARLAAEASLAGPGDVLQFMLALANSCAELNRKIEQLQDQAARAEQLTSYKSLACLEQPTVNIEPGKGRGSVRNIRSSPHYKSAS